MKTILAASTSIALACCATAPVPAVEHTVNADGTTTITLSKKETASCKSEGGCMVLTQTGLRDIATLIIQNACGRETKWQPISKKPLL